MCRHVRYTVASLGLGLILGLGLGVGVGVGVGLGVGVGVGLGLGLGVGVGLGLGLLLLLEDGLACSSCAASRPLLSLEGGGPTPVKKKWATLEAARSSTEEAVAGRPVGRPLALIAPSQSELPGAP